MASAVSSIPVYLNSSYLGMRAERDHLRTVVFPALRQRYAAQSVEPTLADPAEGAQSELEAEGPDTLARRLRDVEQCRPFFIGLLGGPCGPSIDPIPDSALREHGWLAGLAGLTVRHLETRCRTRTGAPAGALFYLRRPDFLATVPAERQTELTETDPARAVAQEDLVRELRQQFTVHEYDARWDPAGGTVTDLTAFGDQVFRDLCSALDRFLAEGSVASPPPAPYLDEDVQFTVYRPKVVQPQKWHPLLAFAHLAQRPPDAGPDEPDPVKEVQRQVAQVLGPRAAEYQDVTQDSRQAVPREGELTFLPEVAGVEFNPPRRTFRWLEAVHREEFRLRAAPELDGKTARGRLSVFLGGILLADVTLSFRVDSRYAPPASEPPLERA